MNVDYVDRLEVDHVERGQLNVLIFGPGKGEAIVVVLPNDEVGAVDGCAWPTDDKTGDGNPAHEFVYAWMKHVGVVKRADQRLAFACITHMHDDHYPGFAALIKRYPPRFLWRTQAFTDRVFEVAAMTSSLDLPSPQATRLRFTIETLDEVTKARTAGTEERTLAADSQPLALPLENLSPVLIGPAGPAPHEVNALAALVVKKMAAQQQLSHDPNATSGALFLRWGDAVVLLAGDLLARVNSKRTDDGWKLFAKYLRDNNVSRVQLVNAAHHGSEGAHDSVLWAIMNPELVVVTPFSHASGSQPPRPTDIERLLKSGSRVLVTSQPRWPKVSSPTPCRGLPALQGPTTSLPGSHAADESDLRNAVLVTLDNDGLIRKIIAAGRASEYKS